MMLFKLVLRTMLFLETVSFAASKNVTAHALFIASNKNLALTVNVANDSENIFFSFVGPDTSSWISFGLGSDRMQSAIMFIVYASSSGQNITLSPRLPQKHAEPTYSPNIQVQVLGGSGISNGTMTANFLCSNCRGDNGTAIGNYALNLSSTSQKMCFASGPVGNLKSNNPNAALVRHSSYGSFMINMVEATGAGGIVVPTVNISAVNYTGGVGSSQITYKADHDASVQAHAAIMIFTFMFLIPFGIFILRDRGSVKWHAINQGVAATLVLVGTALGISVGTQYNRSKNFDTAHQLIGIVIFVAVVTQFTLGYMHHRIYKKTLATTKLAPLHVWLGRFMILAATVCAFLGFPLALSPRSDAWFAGVVVVICLIIGLVGLWSSRRGAKKEKETVAPQTSRSTGCNSLVERPRQYPAVNLPRMMPNQSVYDNARHEVPIELQAMPVEPWQRV